MRKIWDEYDGYFKPVTEVTIKEAESFLKVKLPNSYLEQIKKKNGGRVKFSAFPTNQPNSWAEKWVPFYELAGIDNDLDGIKTIFMTPYMIEEWELPKDIVLLYGEGHYWIALDYRVCGPEGEPSVCWLDVDSEHDFQLAINFESFVDGLVCKSEVA